MRFAVLIPVGPSAIDINRVREILIALKLYEPGHVAECDVFLANDGNTNLADLNEEFSSFRKVVIFDTPGSKRFGHLWDRSITGTFECLRRITSEDHYDFMLKLDTDALVIAPFCRRLFDFFCHYPKAGIIGSYMHFPCGRMRPGMFKFVDVVKRCNRRIPCPHKLITEPSISHHIRIASLVGLRRRMLKMARENGYAMSYHVQGGAYAISGNLLAELKSRGWPPEIDIFAATGLAEDLSLAILCKAAGFELMDYNHPGEVFGVWYARPTLELDEIVKRNYAIIHSLKDRGKQTEEGVRAYFARLRENNRTNENPSHTVKSLCTNESETPTNPTLPRSVS